MENYYLAVSNYDFDEQNKLLKEILGFNRANPSFAIDKDTLFRSVKQRYKSAGKMYNGVALSPNMLNAIEANRVGLEKTFIAPE